MASHSDGVGPDLPEDDEAVPLLGREQGSGARTLWEKVAAVANEPLTPISKVLLITTFFLFLLSSVFIGLFAGLRERLSDLEAHRNGNSTPTVTVSHVESHTITSTTTSTFGTKPTSIPGEKICTSPACVLLAASILSSIDNSKDPCDDFYSFATGGWTKSHFVPTDRGSFGRLTEIEIENRRIIEEILHASEPDLNVENADGQTLRKLRMMYSSCRNVDHLNIQGVDPLMQVVKEVRSIWKLDNSPERAVKKDRLTTVLAYMHSIGVPTLFEVDVDGDIALDPDFMVPIISQTTNGLSSKEYYRNHAVLREYTAVVESLLYELDDSEDAQVHTWPPWPWPPWGNPKPETRSQRSQRLAKAVVALDKAVSLAGANPEFLQQHPIETYNPYTVSEFGHLFSALDLPLYMSAFPIRESPAKMIVSYPSYFVTLSSLIANASAETLDAYFVARVALTYSEYLGLNTTAWRAQRRLQEVLFGIKPGSVGDRGEWCARKVEETLGFASGRFYIQRAFSDTAKAKGTQIIQSIITSFKDSLPSLSWMDNESASAAIAKANNMRVKVGYPLSPNTSDADMISTYYQAVRISRDGFLPNILSAKVNTENKKWEKLGTPRNVESWEMVPSQVNAYFNPPANEIVFPAGIMRPPVYNEEWPSYILYGAFGMVAAHELTHAFDSSGRLYNQRGKLEQWWTNSTAQAFEKIQKCIVDQYSSYWVEDDRGIKVYLNELLQAAFRTIGESIGDAGIIQAYRAWKVQYSESLHVGNEKILPGLSFTRDQLFFIAMAIIWGQSITPQALIQQVLTNEHPPSRFRVVGTLSNLPQFAEAFQCPNGSRMNPIPEHRCRLW